MRIVLDTNAVISGLLWGGAPGQIVRLADQGKVLMFCSPELLAELRRVLQRPKFDRRFELAGFGRRELLWHYQEIVGLVSARPIPDAVTSDSADDAVLACAVAARADIIVSGDVDLPRLRSFSGIPVLPPARALARLLAAR